MKKNLIPIADVDRIEGFLVKRSTLRKWRHLNKYPGLFTNLGRKVFVDMDFLAGLLGK